MTSASRPSRSAANRPDAERRSVILEQSPDSRADSHASIHAKYNRDTHAEPLLAVDGHTLLNLWECALSQSAGMRADAMLRAAFGDTRDPVGTRTLGASRAVDADDQMRGARPLQRVTRLDRSATKAAVAPLQNTRPLPDAAMAGRVASEKRAPDEIVHVTIGRIDCLQRDGRGRP